MKTKTTQNLADSGRTHPQATAFSPHYGPPAKRPIARENRSDRLLIRMCIHKNYKIFLGREIQPQISKNRIFFTVYFTLRRYVWKLACLTPFFTLFLFSFLSIFLFTRSRKEIRGGPRGGVHLFPPYFFLLFSLSSFCFVFPLYFAHPVKYSLSDTLRILKSQTQT